MSNPFIILLVGFLFTLFFGGLTLIRREGLSLRFAIESVATTLVFASVSFFIGLQVEPILFLLVIYILTMRVRILVDFANFFARRKNFLPAKQLYSLAKKVWPDRTNRLIIEVNQGTALLQQGQLDESISLLKTVLAQAETGYLGIKYETATHYNLGVAYQRKNLISLAEKEFEEVIEIWPGSLYSRVAESALKKLKTPKE